MPSGAKADNQFGLLTEAPTFPSCPFKNRFGLALPGFGGFARGSQQGARVTLGLAGPEDGVASNQ